MQITVEIEREIQQNHGRNQRDKAEIYTRNKEISNKRGRTANLEGDRDNLEKNVVVPGEREAVERREGAVGGTKSHFLIFYKA